MGGFDPSPAAESFSTLEQSPTDTLKPTKGVLAPTDEDDVQSEAADEPEAAPAGIGAAEENVASHEEKLLDKRSQPLRMESEAVDERDAALHNGSREDLIALLDRYLFRAQADEKVSEAEGRILRGGDRRENDGEEGCGKDLSDNR